MSHRTRCSECGQWRRVSLRHGDQWWLDEHQRPVVRGSAPCPWRAGFVKTAIILRGVIIRDAIPE